MSRLSDIPGHDRGAAFFGELCPYLRHCGESWRKAWHIGRRCLLDFLLVYIDEGRGRFVVGDDDFVVEAGDLIWIPPDTPHEMWGDPPRMFCTYLHFDLIYRGSICHWDFSIPGGMTDLSDLAPLMHPPLPEHWPWSRLQGKLRLPNTDQIALQMHEICQTALRGGPFSSLKTSGLLMALCCDIASGLEGGEGNLLHAGTIEEAAQILRRDFTVRVEDVARKVKLSVSHLRRLFRSCMGISPQRYQTRARIQYAKQLLMGGNHSIGEVAELCGFSSIQSFSRAFHREEGCSPLAYRHMGRASIRTEARSPYVH